MSNEDEGDEKVDVTGDKGLENEGMRDGRRKGPWSKDEGMGG